MKEQILKELLIECIIECSTPSLAEKLINTILKQAADKATLNEVNTKSVDDDTKVIKNLNSDECTVEEGDVWREYWISINKDSILNCL